MADMEEKLSGDFLFDTVYLQTQVEQLGDSVSQIVSELNLLTEDRYPELAGHLPRSSRKKSAGNLPPPLPFPPPLSSCLCPP